MNTNPQHDIITAHPILKDVFPAESDVPKEYALDKSIEQTEYLIDGEIRTWTKEFEDVYGPVCMQDGQGNIKPKRLGKYPLLDEQESLLALDAAVNAYKNGRGVWPAMAVKDRIRCMQQLVSTIQSQKNAIVKMLMWEIGKSSGDSEKEFDRTIEYIIDTIEELKKMDRENSKFDMKKVIDEKENFGSSKDTVKSKATDSTEKYIDNLIKSTKGNSIDELLNGRVK